MLLQKKSKQRKIFKIYICIGITEQMKQGRSCIPAYFSYGYAMNRLYVTDVGSKCTLV